MEPIRRAFYAPFCGKCGVFGRDDVRMSPTYRPEVFCKGMDRALPEQKRTAPHPRHGPKREEGNQSLFVQLTIFLVESSKEVQE